MRGADVEQRTLFSVVTLESRVPADHPLRKIRPLLDETLESLDRMFHAIYAESGLPSFPPERLIRASLLQVLCSLRSERLIESGVAREIMKRPLKRAGRERLLSEEHFSVDGTLIDAWAASKGLRRRDGGDEPPPPPCNPSVDLHGQRRSNETHVSPIDSEVQRARKGKSHAQSSATRAT
jgi:transposase